VKESGTKLKQLIEGMEQELSEYRKFIEETENIGIVKFDPNEVPTPQTPLKPPSEKPGQMPTP
jgi:hypothetical protein